MRAIQEKYADVGACDFEPRNHIVDKLNAIFDEDVGYYTKRGGASSKRMPDAIRPVCDEARTTPARQKDKTSGFSEGDDGIGTCASCSDNVTITPERGNSLAYTLDRRVCC